MRLAFAMALIIGFNSSASAKSSELENGVISRVSTSVDPNDVLAYSDLVVRCFGHAMIGGGGKGIHHIVNGNAIPGGPAGLLQQCRATLRVGRKMTPEQFSKIRTRLLKTISDTDDELYREKIKNALFRFNKMESESRQIANSNNETEVTN